MGRGGWERFFRVSWVFEEVWSRKWGGAAAILAHLVCELLAGLKVAMVGVIR